MIIEQRLIDLLNKNGPTRLKNRWIIGNIYSEPNTSALPLGYVYIPNDNVTRESTQIDNKTLVVRIGVILKWTSDIKAIDSTPGYKELTRLCNEMDTNLEYKDKTVMRVLLDNRQLFSDKNVFLGLNPNPSIDFDKSPTAGDRPPGIYSLEGVFNIAISII